MRARLELRRTGKAFASFAFHNLLQRHAVSGHRQSGGAGTGTAGAHGRFSAGPDLLRPDALEYRLSGGRLSAAAAVCGAVSELGSYGVSLDELCRHDAGSLSADGGAVEG